MKKIITVSLFAMLVSFGAAAQDKKVAVFDPAGNADKAVKEIIREEISAAVVNAQGYTVLERQMIDRVLEENKFQASGLVDDSQISKMGRLMGANFAFVTNITPMDGVNYHISCKLIDVQSGRIERQQTARTKHGTSGEIMNVIQETVDKMLSDPEVLKRRAEAARERQELEAKAALERRYQEAIAAAKSNVNQRQYAQAKQHYKTALDIKPENAAFINSETDKINRLILEEEEQRAKQRAKEERKGNFKKTMKTVGTVALVVVCIVVYVAMGGGSSSGSGS